MDARVVACGLATLDVVQTLDRLPGPDEKVVAEGLVVESGGPAANAAVTAVALGVPTTLVTRVGGGVLGHAVAGDLAARGVAVVDLADDGDTPPVSTVLVTRSTGERAVVSVNGTLRGAGGEAGRTVDPAVLDGAAVLLVDGHHLDLAVPLARAARGYGVVVVLDGGSWKPGLEELLAHVDVALLSADLRTPSHAGQDADALDAAGLLADVAALGPAHVARSQGAGPVQLLRDGAVVEIAVPAVTAVVDTLGAGDVLHGALAAHLAVLVRDRRPGAALAADDVAAALASAAEVASASCAHPGARGWTTDAPLLTRLRAALRRA